MLAGADGLTSPHELSPAMWSADSPRGRRPPLESYQVITWLGTAERNICNIPVQMSSNKPTMRDLLEQIGLTPAEVFGFAGPAAGPPLPMRQLCVEEPLHQQGLGKEGVVCHLVAVATDHFGRFWRASASYTDDDEEGREQVEHDVASFPRNPHPPTSAELEGLRLEAAFPIGTRVELHSAAAPDAELNGRRGVVLGHTDKGEGKEGRVVVDFGGGYRRAAPREKCTPAPDTPPGSPRGLKGCAPPEPGGKAAHADPAPAGGTEQAGSGRNAWGYDAAAYDAALRELAARARPRLPAGDPRFDELFIARFLRARKLDVDRAEEMLAACLRYRREHGVDEMLRTPPRPKVAAFLRYWPAGIAGHTKSGLRVYWERIGSSRIHEVLGSYISVEEALEAKIRAAEEGVRQAREWSGDDRLRPVVMVLDLGGSPGASVAMATRPHLDFQQRVGSVLEAINPETCERIIVINSGKVFKALYAMMKGFYVKDVRDKLAVWGGPEEHVPKLLELIDEDQLPDFIPSGRLRVGEDWAGDLAHLAALPLHEAHEGLDRCVCVAAGAAHTHRVVVAPGECVEWRFCTEYYDVSVAVSGPGGEVVAAPERHACANAPRGGRGPPHRAGGEFAVTFGNEHARWYAKTVHFRVRSVPAGAEA